MPVATDEAFGALADATRLDIVMRLSRGAASVSELAEPHAMSLRAVLKHVQVLETAGLVRTVKEGRVRRCELDRRGIDAAGKWIDEVRRRCERRLDRLDEYVTKQKPARQEKR
jgi:DNA-binding transcriptional ArsR family regulator